MIRTSGPRLPSSGCGVHARSVDKRFSKSPTSCVLQKETKRPPAVRGLASCRVGRSEGFELRPLFLFGRGRLSSCWLGNLEAVNESPKEQVWEGPALGTLSSRELEGTAVYCSNRCFSFFF